MHMKTLSLITVAFFLVLGVAVSHAAATTGGTHVLTRISNETGVPVDTLQTQKSTTGLGYGSLEHANLLLLPWTVLLLPWSVVLLPWTVLLLPCTVLLLPCTLLLLPCTVVLLPWTL